MKTKYCRFCGVDKPISEFGINRRSKDNGKKSAWQVPHNAFMDGYIHGYNQALLDHGIEGLVEVSVEALSRVSFEMPKIQDKQGFIEP